MKVLRRMMVALGSLAFLATLYAEEKAVVRGVVSDSNDAVYQAPNSVAVRCVERATCGQLSQTAVLNDVGEFRFEIPPGTYELTASVRFNYPYRRAPLRLGAGQSVSLRVSPRLETYAVAYDAGRGDIPYRNPKPKYAKVSLADGREGLIEYETKRKVGDHYEYRNAQFTFQEWSIRAEVIRIDRAKEALVSSGKSRVARGEDVKVMDAEEVSFQTILTSAE